MAKKKPIVSKYGQWKYPGQETIIPDANGRITMQDVPYPVFGIDDLGNQQLMMPGMEYQFPGNSVYEIPMMKNGGTKKVKIHSLPKAQKGAEIIRFQKSLRNPASYQDSIDVANASQKAMDWYIANGYYNLNAPVFIGPKDPQMPIFPENPAEWKAKPNTGPARATHIHLGGHTEFGKDDLGKSGVEWDLPEVEVTIPAGVNQVVQDGFSGLGNLVGEGIAGAANLVKGDELAQWLNDYQFLQYGDEHKRILNKDAPRILYDSRIQPRTNLGLQGTAPGYFSGNADIVDLPLYEKWYTTPWSLLSDADKRKRLEFGILDGTPFKDWNDVRLINSYPDLAMAQGGRRQYDEQTIKNAAASGYAPTQEGAAQYEKNKWAKNPKVYDAQTIANAAKYGYPATQSGAAEYELNNWQRKPSSGSTKPKKEPNANTDIGYYMRTELGLDRKQTSYEERKKLAERYGIENYSGTSKQNMELLNRIKSESDPRESVLNMLSGKNTSTVPNTETSTNASSSKTETDSKSTAVEQPESVKKNVRQHREGIYVTPIHTANNGVVYRVHDKNQKFIAWEDELGNIIPVQNATGSPTSDFDPIYKPKQQTENFAYGGEPDPERPWKDRYKSQDGNYLYKAVGSDGMQDYENSSVRRTLKGFITGAPKPDKSSVRKVVAPSFQKGGTGRLGNYLAPKQRNVYYTDFDEFSKAKQAEADSAMAAMSTHFLLKSIYDRPIGHTGDFQAIASAQHRNLDSSDLHWNSATGEKIRPSSSITRSNYINNHFQPWRVDIYDDPKTHAVYQEVPKPKMKEATGLPIPQLDIKPQLQNLPALYTKGPKLLRSTIYTPDGPKVRVADKNQRFVRWEYPSGESIDFDAKPSGDWQVDFPATYQEAINKKAYGGDISVPDLRRFTVNNLRKAQGGGEGEPQYETITVTDPTDPGYREYQYLQNLYNWSNLQDFDQRALLDSPGYFYGDATDGKYDPDEYTKMYQRHTGTYNDGSQGLFVAPYDPKKGLTNFTSDETGVYGSKANEFNFATKAELDKWIRRNRNLNPGIYPNDPIYANDLNDWNQIMTKYQPIGYDAFIDWSSPNYGYDIEGDYDAGRRRWIYKKPTTAFLEDNINRDALRRIYPQLTDAEIDEYVAEERLNPSYITNTLNPDGRNRWLRYSGQPTDTFGQNQDPTKRHPLVLKQLAFTDPEDQQNRYLPPAGTSGFLPEAVKDWTQTQDARYLPRFGTPESYLGKRYVYEEPAKQQPESPKADPVGHKANVFRTPIHTANNGVVYRVHDDQQKFIAWEDEAGNAIPVENATGSATTDFDPVYKPKVKMIKAPKFKYGGPLPKAQSGFNFNFDPGKSVAENMELNRRAQAMGWNSVAEYEGSGWGRKGYVRVPEVVRQQRIAKGIPADQIPEYEKIEKKKISPELQSIITTQEARSTADEKKAAKEKADRDRKNFRPAPINDPAGLPSVPIFEAALMAPVALGQAGLAGLGEMVYGAASASPYFQALGAGLASSPAWAPGLSVSNTVNAGFAAHGLKTIASGEAIEPWKHAADTGNAIDYLSAFGQNLMTGLEILPVAAPMVKAGLELARPAVNAAGYRLPGMSLPMPEMPAIGPQAEATPWIAESLPGLHLESTITGGPISKIVEPKTGMVNVEQALKIIGKESGGNEKLELVRSALGENIPAKMDYNQFRKLVQDAIIPLERRTVNYRSNYGLGHIGYPSPSKKNIQLALDNSNQEVVKLTEDLGKIESQIADIKGFRESIANDPSKSYMANATDEQLKAYLEGLRSNVETSLITSKKLVESNSKMLAEAPLENETLLLSNKTKLGRGSDAHDNPVETLGHIHYMVDAENPKTLVMTQMQSDAFQSAHNTMHKSRKAAAESLAKTDEYHNKMVELLEDAELIPGGGYRLKDGTEMTAEVYRELTGSGRQTIKDMLQAEVDNFGQKLLLNKKHQERYLQEFVDMAAGKGMDKVRVPTSGTSAKIQGYNPLEFNPNLPEAVDARNKIMEANRLYGPESEQFKTATAEYDAMVNNTKPDYIPSHKTILKKYDEMPKLIKKTFGEEVQIVTDSKGNTWYEFSIPQNFREGKGEIKAFRKGGPLLRAQKGLPVDYQSFLNYSETAPENRRPDTEWQYGNPRQYDHYGMWDALGKPKNFEEALQKNPHWQPDPYDGMYHGFSTNPDTGVWLKSHIPGESHPGDTGWMEYKDFMLSNDANWGGKNQNLVFDPELQRMRYVERKKQGGSMKRVKINALPNNWKTK